jgi:guanylate kinase
MSGTKGHLFVITAPSGAGKSTLIRRTRDRLDRLAFSVSWTTRAPRPGERDGVDYHFTDHETFEAKIAAGEMLEWARVHGELYGTGRAETDALRAGGDDVILDIDVQGAAQLRTSAPEATSIFILPPDPGTLVRRLEGRGTESEESLRRRLAVAADEIREVARFDYVVVNDELETAVAELEAVLRSARLRRERRWPRIREIVEAFVESDGRREESR